MSSNQIEPWPQGLRGSNQSGMRAHNERIVLSLLRRNSALAKAEIARLTGLSAQTVSVIMRSLEADGLLTRGDPVRGKVGQPSVPMRLAPDGAYFYGLKIGRRIVELVLTDFVGRAHGRVHLTHRYPTPDATIRFAHDAMVQLASRLPPGARRRIAGLGIAIPFQLWGWAKSIGIEDQAMEEWKTRDIRAEIAADCPFPVYVENDASAACGAELVLGDQSAPRTFLYFYIGFFVGGGVVLNGSLYTGRRGNAGALGSLPVAGDQSARQQLIDVASLAVLEKSLDRIGRNTLTLWGPPEDWDVDDDVLTRWIGHAASGLANAIVAAASVIDFEAALLDGWLPKETRSRLVVATEAELAKLNLDGLDPPEIRPGTVGPDARALGAACLPLSDRFLVNHHAQF